MREQEIRPKEIFDEYLRLAALDGQSYFDPAKCEPISCPACGSLGRVAFRKHNFSYEECNICQTLYVSPRPPGADFFRYYQNSESAKYFATTFYKATADARREKLWRPKAIMVHEAVKNFHAEQFNIIDIGGGYGIFAEEYQALTGAAVTIIEPGPQLAEICRDKGLNVVEEFLEKIDTEQLPEGPRFFVSFELFEHLHDCNFFLSRLSSLMQPGDLFLFTTLSGMGVDIQALWSESNSISLQHLNFFNPKSIRLLIDGMGLRAVKVETPGKLDLDILFNNKSKIQDRFWKNFIDQTSVKERAEWQFFLANHGYSSHMLVVCDKPKKF
jgi:hypothetical protein